MKNCIARVIKYLLAVLFMSIIIVKQADIALILLRSVIPAKMLYGGVRRL